MTDAFAHTLEDPPMPNRPPQYVPPGELERRKQAARDRDAGRGTAAQRGYDYRWQKLRIQILNRDPLCVLCKAKGLVVESTHCDHIVPKSQGGTDDPSNLRGLCAHCNLSKGGVERHAAAQDDGNT